MLTNKIFNASALKVCFERFVLSIKFIYAYWQTYFCFLSNVRLFTIKYIRFI